MVDRMVKWPAQVKKQNDEANQKSDKSIPMAL